MKQIRFNKTVDFVNKLLANNKEWVVRYKSYARTIISNQHKYKDARKKFRIRPPFYLYTNITNLLQSNNTLNYDLRFLGQSVATIKIKGDNVTISTKKKDSNNQKFFGVNVQLHDENWNGYNASKFRKEFNKCTKATGHSKEHKIESGLLSEFVEKDRSKKALPNIQPVLLAKAFFQMATPVKASLSEIKYANAYGGGIDILARVKHKDNSVKICVMELKDEYTNTEPPCKVMNQAIAYATFIANLLRSESGNVWYRIFGFSGDVPPVLTIDVAAVMPLPPDKQAEDFNGERIKVLEDTFLDLYSLYFTEKPKYSDGFNYVFEGPLKGEMMS